MAELFIDKAIAFLQVRQAVARLQRALCLVCGARKGLPSIVQIDL